MSALSSHSGSGPCLVQRGCEAGAMGIGCGCTGRCQELVPCARYAEIERQRVSAMARARQAEEALRKIHGHFLPGVRNTYLPGAETLDLIRSEAEAGLLGCDCLGTPDQEDCPHE